MNLERLETIGPSHFADLMCLYRGEWWSRERSPDDVRRMLDGTDEIIAFAADGRLVAFARVVTDHVYKAFVFDVIVDPAQHRAPAVQHAMQWGRGLVTALADRFIGMYVNDLTLDLGTRGRAGIDEFLRRGHAAGLVPGPLALEFAAG